VPASSKSLALYHAKERSRGTFIEYNAGLGTTLTRRFRAIRDVSLALAENRIHAHYQPIVRLDTGEVVGFEALCRMTTTSGEIIAAANFHEATKDAHVAAKLTECMLLCVARDMRAWLDGGLPFQHVGINLSAADFNAGHLQERLCAIFADAGVPLKHVILEVTESVYLGQRDHVVAEEIKSLRNRGMRVALDDFGTGFASLTHLLTVPVDIIKIDKSFVERLVPGHGAVIIVEGLLSIAAKLGLRVVAEGIETDAQLDQLLSFGCRLGQGYLFSKAVDQDAATSLLARYGQHAEIGRSRAARLSVYRAKRSYLSAIRRKPCSDTMLDVLRAQASRWSMSARDLHVWIPLGPADKALPVWMVCIPSDATQRITGIGSATTE